VADIVEGKTNVRLMPGIANSKKGELRGGGKKLKTGFSKWGCHTGVVSNSRRHEKKGKIRSRPKLTGFASQEKKGGKIGCDFRSGTKKKSSHCRVGGGKKKTPFFMSKKKRGIWAKMHKTEGRVRGCHLLKK